MSKGLCIAYPNACFYVSMLQCILHSPPLTMYFLLEYPRNVQQNTFVESYANLVFEYFRSDTKICNATTTRQLFNSLCTYFDNGDQHDAHEAFVYCLDSLHKGLSVHTSPESPMRLQSDADRAAWQDFIRVEGHSAVSEIFVMHRKYTFTYNDTVLQEVYDYQTVHSTELHGSVCQSILSTFEPETVSYTHQGTEVIATKHTVPVYMPLALVVHVKRFDARNRKIDTKIDVEKVMTIFGTTYHLVAMSIHYGSAQGGHYISVVGLGNEWTVVNDTTAHSITEHDLNGYNPYICLYKKL